MKFTPQLAVLVLVAALGAAAYGQDHDRQNVPRRIFMPVHLPGYPARHPHKNRYGSAYNPYASSMNMATFGTQFDQSMPGQHEVVIEDERAWLRDGTRAGWHQPMDHVISFVFGNYQGNYDKSYKASPWYYYSNLPGYIGGLSSNNSPASTFSWGAGQAYRWALHNRHDVAYGGNGSLDFSVDTISDAFNNHQPGQFQALLPHNHDVIIDMDGQAPYTLSCGDFENLLSDVINQTDTQQYTIDSVTRNGNYATVKATHKYRDADGQIRTQQHWYGLVADSPDWRIVSFRSQI